MQQQCRRSEEGNVNYIKYCCLTLPRNLVNKPRRRRIGRNPLMGQPKLFGGSLEEYLEATGQEIPLIMKSCIRVINLYGEKLLITYVVLSRLISHWGEGGVVERERERERESWKKLRVCILMLKKVMSCLYLRWSYEYVTFILNPTLSSQACTTKGFSESRDHKWKSITSANPLREWKIR